MNIKLSKLKEANDQNVIQHIYAEGNTDGVFQFESDGIKKALVNFKPHSIDDIILMNAAYRPGPMDSIPEFTAVKLGEKDPAYLVPDMEKILGNTYGSAIYQEQIMQLFQMVGFSLGEADIIRRAMSKKHLDEIEAAKEKFVAGMKAKGASDEAVEAYWTRLLAFASYAFNKSHAAAYSILSYYTAWLKFYSPCEFMAAQMSYTPHDKVPYTLVNVSGWVLPYKSRTSIKAYRSLRQIRARKRYAMVLHLLKAWPTLHKPSMTCEQNMVHA